MCNKYKKFLRFGLKCVIIIRKEFFIIISKRTFIMIKQTNTTNKENNSQVNTYSNFKKDEKGREEVADKIITGAMTDGNVVVAAIYDHE